MNSIAQSFGIGIVLAEVLANSDVWNRVNKIRGYQVPYSVVIYELQFASIGIIRKTIKRRISGNNAEKLLYGIDTFVDSNYRIRCTKQFCDHYGQATMHIVAFNAIRCYESVAFPLNEFGLMFARRLSIVALPDTEIAALFDEVKAEAEASLRFTTALPR